MSYNSIVFWIFLVCVLLLYYLFLPKRFRYIWVLLCSYFVYFCWDFRYMFFLLFSTISTWCGGIYLEKVRSLDKPKGKLGGQ